ncbi:hypothetical protein H477_1762 [[Clostridium] sordellii ATCC 9714]|nr:hypothetical protein H477_1762 [[Clostridium] sordellii ATCC 9714] [Paeniclostridium sordellii ATCC 9714]
MKDRKEIKLYKILKHISVNKNLKLIKDKDGFYIGKNLVKPHSDNKIYVNEEIVYIKDFEKM